MIGSVKTHLMKASFIDFFQPEYKKGFTDELLVSWPELLRSGEVPEENDKKNCINNAEESKVYILSPIEECLLQKEC
jgi:hypothetical protein